MADVTIDEEDGHTRPRTSLRPLERITTTVLPAESPQCEYTNLVTGQFDGVGVREVGCRPGRVRYPRGKTNCRRNSEDFSLRVEGRTSQHVQLGDNHLLSATGDGLKSPTERPRLVAYPAVLVHCRKRKRSEKPPKRSVSTVKCQICLADSVDT